MNARQFLAKPSAPDLDRTPRPVIAIADEYPPGFVDPRHSHRRAQLLYASAGVMSVITERHHFVVPPQRALWLPAGAEHEVACRGPVSLRTLYFEPDMCDALPDCCSVIEISDLLRELIVAVTKFEAEYNMSGREGRIMQLILEEIALTPGTSLHAPLPKDPRLMRVCRAILADLSHEGDLDDWARIAGMGRRTLTRLFRGDTGMSLAAWRLQVRLLEALSLLSIGRSVTRVAYEVGYDSPSAFTAVFTRTFGSSPSQYLARGRLREGPTASN
jgi:AraC-like DNA-binding protein